MRMGILNYLVAFDTLKILVEIFTAEHGGLVELVAESNKQLVLSAGRRTCKWILDDQLGYVEVVYVVGDKATDGRLHRIAYNINSKELSLSVMAERGF